MKKRFNKKYISALFAVVTVFSLVYAYSGGTPLSGGVIPDDVGYHELRYISNGTASVDANEDGIIDVAERALTGGEGGGGAGGADTDWTIDGDNMYSGVSGNVGIGDTSPGDKLSVKTGDEDAIIRIDSGLTAPKYSAIDFYNAGSGIWRIGKNPLDDFYINEFGLNMRFFIQRFTGNIGIGPVLPMRPLHIGAAQDADIRLQDYNFSDGTAAYIEFCNASNRLGYLGLPGNANNFIQLASEQGRNIIISSSGYVGINTDAPTQTLDVNGNLRVRGDFYAGSASMKYDTGTGVLSTEYLKLTGGSAPKGCDVFADSDGDLVCDPGSGGSGSLPTTCNPGDILQWNGSSWECADLSEVYSAPLSCTLLGRLDAGPSAEMQIDVPEVCIEGFCNLILSEQGATDARLEQVFYRQYNSGHWSADAYVNTFLNGDGSKSDVLQVGSNYYLKDDWTEQVKEKWTLYRSINGNALSLYLCG